MAGMTAGIAGHCAQTNASISVTFVVDERPGAIERSRPQEIGSPSDDVARRVANAAGDAVGERGIQMPLDVRDDVENRLAFMAGNFVRPEASVRLAAPDCGVKRLVHPCEFTAYEPHRGAVRHSRRDEGFLPALFHGCRTGRRSGRGGGPRRRYIANRGLTAYRHNAAHDLVNR